MKRRLTGRLLSGVLTMTLIFSSLSVPAYAAGVDGTDDTVISTEGDSYTEEGSSEIVSAEKTDIENDEATTESIESSEEDTDTEAVTESVIAETEESEPEEEESSDIPDTELMGEGEPATSGTLSTGMKWSYNESTKVLTIEKGTESDSCYMPDFASASDAPWNVFDYESIQIDNLVHKIGKNAFAGKESLKSVTFKANSITEIGDNAFKDTSLEEADFSNLLLTSIGESAFENTKLTSIVFENAYVKDLTIGANAFKNTELTELIIPSNVVSIGSGAFSNGKQPCKVAFDTLDFTVGSGGGLFAGSKISEIVFPIGCTEIPEGLFSKAVFPEGFVLTIPASVTSIGNSAFSGDVNGTRTNISKVVFEDGSKLEDIFPYAFAYSEIKEVDLPDSLRAIWSSAFYCSKLTELTIPENVQILESDAFGKIDKLNKLTINSKWDISATHPFTGTTIDDIEFAEGTKVISKYLFVDAILAMDTFRIPEGIETIGDQAICPDKTHSVTKVIIPSSVTSIGTSGISNNRRSDDSVIDCYAPAGSYAATWVSQNAASEKLRLVSDKKSIVYNLYGGTNAPENPYWYDAADETITLYAPKKNGYSFMGWKTQGGWPLSKSTDDDGKDIWVFNTEYAGNDDYDAGRNLVFAAIWENGSYSFTLDSNGGTMPSEYVAEPFTLSFGAVFPTEKYVEPAKTDYVFSGWYTKPYGGKLIEFGTTKVTSDILPKNGSDVTLYAHYRQAAGKVGKYDNIRWSITTDGTLTFNAVTEGLTDEQKEDPESFYLPDYNRARLAPWYSLEDEIKAIDLGNVKKIGKYDFSALQISEINLTKDLKDIGQRAFYECSSLETVNVNVSRLNYAYDQIFLGCNIKNVTFGSEVTAIPAALFYQATFAPGTVITIPANITEIGGSAFDAGYYTQPDSPQTLIWTQGISGVVFEEGSQLESIGMYAFAYTDISTLDLPTSLREIQDYAFRGTKISEIVIPDGLTRLCVAAFDLCPNLVKVTVPASVTEYGYMYDKGWNKISTAPVIFTNDYMNKKGVIQTNKTPIQFFAPAGSPGYAYAEKYGKEYNLVLNPLVSSLIFYNAGAGDAAKGVESGIFKIGTNNLMGSTAAQVKEGLDLSVVKAADPGFNEADLLSDKGFVQAVRTDDVIVLDGNEFVKPGFTLTGWKNENTKKILKNGDVLKLGKDNKAVTLTAQWKQDKYSVKYNLNGGKYTDSKKKGITSYKTEFDANTGRYVFARTLLPNCNGEGSYNEDMIVKPGYRFDGWYENKLFTGAAVEYVGGDVFRSFNLYAKWIPEQYEVILNGNKGIQNAKAVLPGVGPSAADNVITTAFEHDKTYKLTTDLFVRNGYTLDSWNTKADGSGRKYAKNAKLKNLPSDNRTLYAQWKPVTYKITYDLKGGTIAGAPKTYDPEKGTVINVPVKKGYELSAFYLTMEDGSSVTADLNVETKDEEVLHYTIAAATDSKVNYGNIKLTAEWSAKTYKVIYDLNTDKLAPGKDRTLEVSYDYDEQFNISEYLDVLEGRLNDEAKQSMSIASFTAKDNGKGKKYALNKWYSKLADGGEVHIYAKWNNKKATRTAWTPVTYKVVINPNYSGVGNQEIKDVKFKDSTERYPAETYVPKRDGYTFMGFNTKKNGKGIYIQADTDEGGDYYTFEGLSTKNGSTVNLYAIWKANTYTVTYESEVGFDRNDNPKTIVAGKKYILSKAVKKGYTFGGWFAPALADNELQKIQGGSIGAILPGNHGDIEFEAAFTENTYSLSLALNGGKDYNEPKIKTYKLDSEIPYTGEIETTLTAAESEFDRAGYVLKGFALDKKGKKMLMYYGEDSDTLNTDSIYYKEGHISGLTDKNKGKVTVYAIWEKVKAERPVISYAYNSGGTIKVGFTVTNTPVLTDYEVQISDNMLFRSGTYARAEVKNNEAVFNKEEGKTYYVRVRQRRSDTWGNQVKSKWSAIRSTKVIYE